MSKIKDKVKKISNLRRALIAALCALLLWVAAPAVILFRFNLGSLCGGIVLSTLILVSFFEEEFTNFCARHVLFKVAGIAVFAAGLALAATLLFAMAVSAQNKGSGCDTVIIPGCSVDGEKPGDMLTARCDAALCYLEENPNAVIIASGTITEKAKVSEAQAIRTYLIENGVEEGRIFVDDSAKNTSENMKNSARIIEENGLSREVAIVTNGFHQYRAALFARENTLVPYAVNCRVMWLYEPASWIREMVGTVRAYILGY
ncbi:MAG: YdcF family protein [Oscillospiraceae bacterium]